ncbi:phosphoribosylanthranilate isomerase [Blattabacterium cuenoti]|uniref:phosphoribosylanthranilate isomerase n=1 Tax=Blattabacterium cuenoti TaxID=1653831 RepID=UPI001EE9D0D6|nr:phosphoribosylanthranilate isomerase [Blattabacterium cuenoti]
MKNNLLKIKICGIRYDIKEISKLNPDFMGFIFYPKSPRFVGFNFSIENINNNSVSKVGVFVDEKKENIIKIYNEKKLNFIQLHGKEKVSFCEFLFKKGIKIIKSFKINNYFPMKILSNYIPFCSYFIFDNNGGSGRKFDWKKLYEYDLDKKFFLSGGISVKDINNIKNFFHPKIYGIDINSKFEIYPGKKNKKKIKIFIEKIKYI